MKINFKLFLLGIFIALSGVFLVLTQPSTYAWNNHPSPTGNMIPTPTEKEDCDKDKGHFDKCQKPTPTVMPTGTPSLTPTPTETLNNTSGTGGGGGNPPTFAGSSTEAPVCTSGDTVQLPANIFVVRKGSQAVVNFFITEGNSANIWVKLHSESDWNKSVTTVRDITPNGDNFVSYTVNDLDSNTAYDFGIQQKFGCGSGKMVMAVVIDGPLARIFTLSYWEWAR